MNHKFLFVFLFYFFILKTVSAHEELTSEGLYSPIISVIIIIVAAFLIRHFKKQKVIKTEEKNKL